MNRLSTLRDLYRHLDWASDRVLAAAEPLDDDRLDRPFDMGMGNLRKTLWHVWSAHWLWFTRLGGESPTTLLPDGVGSSIADLRRFAAAQRASHDATLSAMSDADIDRDVSYRNTKGEAFVARRGAILLHAANHAAHHHAQALNMLRHSGVEKPPRLDYLFMYWENRDWPAPALSVDLIKDYYAYTDWARNRVMDVAQQLDDAQLDRPFEMGIGSIRKNFAHTHDAERWWLTNWLAIPSTSGAPFPKTDDTMPLRDLRALFDDTAKQRSDFLARTRDDDLTRDVEGTASPGRTFKFPLGVTMVQLNKHGTHHRAQTINMLRQCGQTTPPTDYVLWARENPKS
jgi:uncharacterized damage-inducible protein DinB